jgi:hypothetical protein
MEFARLRQEGSFQFMSIFPNRQYVALRLWLTSDKFTPKTNEGKDHPLGYIRRMKYTMSTKELARLAIVKYHRQSRWLVFMNRSKRLILEPPKGGFCA